MLCKTKKPKQTKEQNKKQQQQKKLAALFDLPKQVT